MRDLRVTKRTGKFWTDGLKCQGAAQWNFVARRKRKFYPKRLTFAAAINARSAGPDACKQARAARRRRDAGSPETPRRSWSSVRRAAHGAAGRPDAAIPDRRARSPIV